MSERSKYERNRLQSAFKKGVKEGRRIERERTPIMANTLTLKFLPASTEGNALLSPSEEYVEAYFTLIGGGMDADQNAMGQRIAEAVNAFGGMEAYFARQIEWSRQTFGPAERTKGVIDHIRKELGEIERDPHDLSEWIDVVILAMDGFWRHGGNARDLMPALLAKQHQNIARIWPDWRTMSEDSAIEHDRSHDAPNTSKGNVDG